MNLSQIWELKNYADDIGAIIAYLVAITSIVVKIVPTLDKNNRLLPIIKFVSKYVALNRKTKDDILRK